MLGDVLEAAASVGSVVVATSDPDGIALASELGGAVVLDPGGGQGAAVAAALASLPAAPVLVVNGDVPCVRAADLRGLLAAIPAHGLALVRAADGTTNALGLSTPSAFEPLYGAGSAARFLAIGLPAVSVVSANLADDVDTLDDLERLRPRLGARSRAVHDAQPLEALG
jgi:2-phospho-L-lactate guanylyltransferase